MIDIYETDPNDGEPAVTMDGPVPRVGEFIRLRNQWWRVTEVRYLLNDDGSPSSVQVLTHREDPPGGDPISMTPPIADIEPPRRRR